MQEYEGLKRDWLGEIKPSLMKNLSLLLNISFSNVLLHTRISELVWSFFENLFITFLAEARCNSYKYKN